MDRPHGLRLLSVARRAAAVVAASGVLAASCGDARPDLVIPDVDLTAELAESSVVFVAPEIEQVDCPDEIAREHLACAIAEVALDHESAPGGQSTAISFAVLDGTGGDAPAVVVAQGGPGGASSDLAGWLPRQPFTQVFVDQRGTGFAGTDFDCPEYDAALPLLLEVPADDVLSLEEDALAECAARLEGGGTFAETDTESHAEDVQTLMLALGYGAEWYFYGVSYGSTIGIELLSEPRVGLQGVILDGVYPPSLDLDTAVGVSARSSVDAITTACRADARCAAFTDDFGADLDALVEELDRAPLVVTVDSGESGFGQDLDIRLDGERLADLTFVLLYGEANVAGLPAAIARMRDGDREAARWLAAAGSRALASAYRANDEGTYFAVQCRDRVPLAGGLAPTGRSFPDAVVTQPLSTACDLWDREPATLDEVVGPLESASIPALLLSGTFDPITPPAYAMQLASELERATVVTQDGRSHGIWIGNDCIQRIVRAFVAGGGSVAERSCADEPVPVDWFSPG